MEIEKILIASINNVSDSASSLIERHVNERTICGRLQVAINKLLEDSNICADIEYNRMKCKNHDGLKKIPFKKEILRKLKFNDSKTNEKYKKFLDEKFNKIKEEKMYIIPDIIIHDCADNNIAFIEVKKKSNSKRTNDLFKISIVINFDRSLNYERFYYIEYDDQCNFDLYRIEKNDNNCGIKKEKINLSYNQN